MPSSFDTDRPGSYEPGRETKCGECMFFKAGLCTWSKLFPSRVSYQDTASCVAWRKRDALHTTNEELNRG